jgi:hypothetical protein
VGRRAPAALTAHPRWPHEGRRRRRAYATIDAFLSASGCRELAAAQRAQAEIGRAYRLSFARESSQSRGVS